MSLSVDKFHKTSLWSAIYSAVAFTVDTVPQTISVVCNKLFLFTSPLMNLLVICSGLRCFFHSELHPTCDCMITKPHQWYLQPAKLVWSPYVSIRGGKSSYLGCMYFPAYDLVWGVLFTQGSTHPGVVCSPLGMSYSALWWSVQPVLSSVWVVWTSLVQQIFWVVWTSSLGSMNFQFIWSGLGCFVHPG